MAYDTAVFVQPKQIKAVLSSPRTAAFSRQKDILEYWRIKDEEGFHDVEIHPVGRSQDEVGAGAWVEWRFSDIDRGFHDVKNSWKWYLMKKFGLLLDGGGNEDQIARTQDRQ